MYPNTRYAPKTMMSVGRDLAEWKSLMEVFAPVWFSKILRQKDVGIVQKEINDMLFYVFPFLKDDPSELPDFNSFKTVRWVREAKKVPDIGDDLNKMIRSYPLSHSNCYYWALLTSLAFPGVNIVRGIYPLSATVQKKIESTNQSDIEYHENIIMHVKDINSGTMNSGYSRYINNWWKKNKSYFLIDKKGRMWTNHAWNIYDGVHFDVAYSILNKRYQPKNWYSKNKGKWIYWTEYKMDTVIDRSKLIKKFNISDNKIQAIKFLMTHMWFSCIAGEVQNGLYGSRFRFPVNRQWMKKGYPFPDFNPEETGNIINSMFKKH